MAPRQPQDSFPQVEERSPGYRAVVEAEPSLAQRITGGLVLPAVTAPANALWSLMNKVTSGQDPDIARDAGPAFRDVLALTGRGTPARGAPRNALYSGGGPIVPKGGKGSRTKNRSPTGSPILRAMQTVMRPNRMMYPGVYDDPVALAQQVEADVPEESGIMKRLWNVDRQDLYDIAANRVGNRPSPLPPLTSKQTGSAAARNVMNPRNTQRLQDLLQAGEDHAPNLMRGMGGWYVQDPQYQHLVSLVGPEEANRLFDQRNTLNAYSSPMTAVPQELQRGSAANAMMEAGQFDDFVRYGGNPSAAPRGASEHLEGMPGSPAHGSQHPGMERFRDTGVVLPTTAKVPTYRLTGGVPETGFQTDAATFDSHGSRNTGFTDVRGGSDKNAGDNPGLLEAQTLAPWYQDKVALPTGNTSATAQPKHWGITSKATGVTTPVGMPKLEIYSELIKQRAYELGISPETMRDYDQLGIQTIGVTKNKK